jgi:hypothetical protein
MEYEMEYVYFHINRYIYEQNKGLPMGGFLSALLVIIDAMAQEQKHKELWTQEHGRFRFRDDILAIIPKKLNGEEIEKIVSDMNEIYGPDLKIQLEESSQEEMQFLDYNIKLGSTTIETSKAFKNTPKQTIGKSGIIRYIHPMAHYPRDIKIVTIMGALNTVKRRANTKENKIKGIFQSLQEFVLLNYNTKLLLESAYRMDYHTSIMDTIRKALGKIKKLKREDRSVFNKVST